MVDNKMTVSLFASMYNPETKGAIIRENERDVEKQDR